MAKIIVFNNVFDINDSKEYASDEQKSIKDFLYDNKLEEIDYSCCVEVYDPDTGETSYQTIEDDEDDMIVNIVVNGKVRDLDYVIQKSDLVIIHILPASGMTGEQRGGLAEGLLGLVLLGLGIAATIASGGVAFVAFGGAFMGSAIAVNFGMLGAGLLAASAGIFMMLDGGKKLFGNGSEKQIKDDTAEKNPTLNGAQNQPLGENAFPLNIGNNHVTPYIVGSPYTEFEYSETMDKSWFGNKQKMNLLLGVAYGPQYIEDIRLDQLPIAQNKQKVLNGILSYEREGEIGASWKNNKPRFEITQMGNKRTIYPYTVKQKNINAALLYCYDNMYSEIATEHTITWQGGTFPTGMRTNSVYFSESVPCKIAVGIKFPNGLYRTHKSESGDTTYYTKIPMNLVVQWRPYYKYVKENGLDTDVTGSEDAYDYRTEGYTEGRYGKWRNFDDSKIIPKITYTSDSDKNTIYYTVDNKAYLKDGYYGYYAVPTNGIIQKNSQGYYYIDKETGELKYVNVETDGKFVPCVKKMTTDECKIYAGMIYDNGQKTSMFARTNTQIVYEGVSYSCTKTVGGKTNDHSERTVFMSRDEFIKNTYLGLYLNQENNFISKYTNKNLSFEYSVSEREVSLNLGLTDGTSKDCNPYWNGATAFSFGKASGGQNMYSEADPSLTKDAITKANVEDAKDEMDFELTATLTQEDILDLINMNPKSIEAGYIKDDILDGKTTGLEGLTDVVFDSIQVRVIRLTPCYVDKTVGSTSYTYQDVVQWSYLKTYCLDKEKLLHDINYIEYGHTFPKINCNSDCYEETGIKEIVVPDGNGGEIKQSVNVPEVMAAEGSSRWNEWNIEDYYSRPLNDVDEGNLVTVGVEVRPDKLGYLSGSIDKINLTAKSIMPAYKFDGMNGKTGGYTRYVKKSDDVCFFCDRYDSQSDILDLDTVTSDKLDWQFCALDSANSDEFNDIVETARIVIGESDGYEYSYYVKNEAWDNIFFPKKIERQYVNQLITDVNGNAIFEEDGHTPKMEKVKSGNDWFDYIRNEMSMNVDEYGRWIATESFKNTFCDQNAIVNALGFMTGKSLGKDAYTFNSHNNNKLIRIWRTKGEGKDREYYCYNTELEEPVKENEWQYVIKSHKGAVEGIKREFIEEAPVEISYTDPEYSDWTFYYSFRKVNSDFNPLALKESIEYTDSIDVGGSVGGIKYCCNLYLYQQQKVIQILSTILTAGRAYWFYDENGRYEIHNDRPLKNPVLLVTDENVIQFSNTRSFSKMIAGFHITFNDENNDGQQGEIYVLREGQTRENHTRDIKDITLPGITNGQQAWAIGAYLLGQSITQREVWNIKLNHVGSALTIGSLIEVQSKSLQIGTDTSGRIIRLIEDGDYIYGFILDNMYKYRGEYNEDGSNVQGCTIMQAIQSDESRVVTVRFANKEQQEAGINVRFEGMNILYRNNVGMTNCILFEKKIVKETSKQYGQIPDEETGVTSLSTFTPKIGDLVAFGNVGSITSKAVVTSVVFDEKRNVTISTYPYFDSLYNSGSKLPIYQANVTKKPIIDNMPTNTESYKVISDAVDANNEVIDEKINSIDINTFTVTPASQTLSCDEYGNILRDYTETEIGEPIENQVKIRCELYEKGTLYDTTVYEVTVNGEIYKSFTENEIYLPLDLFEKNNVNTISVKAKGFTIERIAEATVSKVYAGKDGDYPIQYDLLLDHNAIHIGTDRSINPTDIIPTKIKTINSTSVKTDYGEVFASVDGGPQIKVGNSEKDTSGVYNDSVTYQAQYTPFKLKVGVDENGEDIYLGFKEDLGAGKVNPVADLFFSRTNI